MKDIKFKIVILITRIKALLGYPERRESEYLNDER